MVYLLELRIMDPNIIAEIVALRSRNLTPKQIARKLGLKPAQVNSIIKGQASELAVQRQQQGEMDAVYECLVNASFNPIFLRGDSDNQAIVLNQNTQSTQDEASGLVTVVVTRSKGPQKLSTAMYLVDYLCLGIKNAIEPRNFNRSNYLKFVNQIYFSDEESYRKITLEEAQAIVFSALEYAEKLGFKPHQDFAQASKHLGQWDQQLRIQCGKDGKPMYVSGPYDNPDHVLATLDKNVGPGNYNYLVGLEPEGLF